MKKILLLLSACAVLVACKPDPVKYGDLIIGSWEVKEKPTIEISGATSENYDMLRQEMRDRFDRVGDVFEFKTGNLVAGPDVAGTYSITGNLLRIVPDGENALNFTIASLNNRTLVITYDAIVEMPRLTELYPKPTKCLVTVTAVKKNKASTN